VPGAHDALLGRTIGEHYVIEQAIGEGAMGRVYRARHALLSHKHYAVKVLFGDVATSAAMRVRFTREAQAASRLEHPNIVAVLDVGRSTTGLMYLVMDLVEGDTLARVIRRGPIAPARAIALALQLCAGLAHAHARDLVHRDFKPDNILVTPAGDARIVDFGLALSLHADDARLTTSGILCTPAYAAPEQLVGGRIDHRADLYALGITLYEMLTGGKLPFDGNSNDVMTAKLARTPPSVLAAAPDVPAGLARLIAALLQRDASRRPRSAREVADRLAGLAPAEPAPAHSRGRTVTALAVAAIGSSLGWFAATTPVGRLGSVALPASPERISLRSALPSDDVPVPVPVPASRPPPPLPLRPPRAPTIRAFSVEGSLPPSVVRRALSRALPAFTACARRVGHRTVDLHFTIDESRRASRRAVAGAGGACLASALLAVRTEEAPDVGDCQVDVQLAF
jgi:serine/threonine-protein kinase